ncbi:MAG: C4-dicarboxylic acid transporter DauA [Actinomycetota bacterium]|jgi:SulP family sulfate permease|nr:C4-dicarboxylic acid transporter DauA [Actinomycetota bacterium]
MPHRVQLTTVRVSSALRDALGSESYSPAALRSDVLAGLTVAIVAMPLAMALAIASGVPPQYGLYSAIIGGFVAALTGGSRYSVSGPTAAFVVILAPVTAQYGMAGLATAGLMAGVILVAFGVSKLGRLIEYVPEPVTVGFTSGIAVVIAVLQLNDFFGLGVSEMPESFLAKLATLARALPQAYWAVVLVGTVTLLVKVFWPQDRLVLPGYAPAILVGTLLSIVLAQLGHPIDTIGSRFTFEIAGVTGHGIPQMLPHLVWPWALPGPGGEAFVLSWSSIRDLLPAALSIAVLGAIESLLCAVVLDRSTNTRHHSNGELLGQGLANITTPFFGGVPVTAAIARSAANVSAGARTPLAAAIHSVSVLIGVLALAPLLAYIPMASMAAVLLTVAWNMSEAPTAVSLLERAPRADKLVFVVCFALTVIFDMVLAIGVGIALAAFLLMRDIARFTQVRDVSDNMGYVGTPLPADWRMVKIIGAMFFAAADRVLTQLLNETADGSNLIIYADGITLLDAGGTGAFERFFAQCESRHIRVILVSMQTQPERTLMTSGILRDAQPVELVPKLSDALALARADSAAA